MKFSPFSNGLVPVLLAVAVIFVCGCTNSPTQKKDTASPVVEQEIFKSESADDTTVVETKYARGFKVEYKNGMKLLEISDPTAKENESFRFALVADKSKPVPHGYIPITIPVSKVICMTTLQLAGFIAIEETERVCAMTSTRYLHNPIVKEQIKNGITKRIGIEGNFDNEVIIDLNPDIIFISPFKRGGYDAIKDIGIPLVPHLGYKEPHPLGQAEWIKFVALFINEEAKANRIFNSIAEQYNMLKARTDSIKERPTVLSGEIHGGPWYAVGGASFLAHLFKDAGADYFLKENNESGGINFDFETIYEKAANSQYWRIMNGYQGEYTYEVLGKTDPRYKDFRAFKERRVIYCNQREKGFYESSPVNPHLVLKDLIKIFHPSLIEADYQPVYYTLLDK